MLMPESLLPFGLGGLVGLLLGLTGAGGGIFSGPLLILVMQLPLPVAAPVSLVSVALGSMLGMGIGLRQGIVRYRAALLMAGAGLLATPLGIYLARLLPALPLLLCFAGVLAYQGWRQWGTPAVVSEAALPCVRDEASGRFLWNRPCFRVMTLAGLLAGFLSGLLGVGGGFVLNPALRRHTALPMPAISATTLMVLAIVSCGGLIQWLQAGAINWTVGGPFVAGVLLTTLLARCFAHRVPEAALRRLFAVLCLLASAGMLYKALGA